MKVTVWRPKLPEGLGPPTACLREDHPTEGDWHLSAKHDFQPDGYRPLHMMGREFLIYSMYHATDPYFIGIAVENFGAACQKLGYKLPLKEDEAVWLTYPPGEVEPSTAENYNRMFAAIAEVFGPKTASDQAKTLGRAWPTHLPKPSSRSPQR